MLEIKTYADKAEKISFEKNPKFGTIFTPCYLKMKLSLDQKSDFKAEILPFKTEEMSPGTSALHYGQSIFEGMKAYRQKDGSIAVFRAEDHAKRFKNSAHKMVMAELPEEVFLEAIKAYVHFNRENVPHEEGHSLYLRPLLFASDPIIKVAASKTYEFLIMSTIAGNYFSGEGFAKKAKLLVSKSFVRAFPGGTGEVKTAGNYAAGMYSQNQAVNQGCDQVLFLDAVEHEYIDELGGMNFFAIRGNQLVTPQLNGCILHGVTRRSILALASRFDLEAVEERMSFSQLVDDIRSGKIQECFACGTAAIISPIGEFLYQKEKDGPYESVKLKSADFPVTQKLLTLINQIHRGAAEVPGNWLYPVNL